MKSNKIHWDQHINIYLIPLVRELSFRSRNAMWYSRNEYKYMVENNLRQALLQKNCIEIESDILRPTLQHNNYNLRDKYLRTLGIYYTK